MSRIPRSLWPCVMLAQGLFLATLCAQDTTDTQPEVDPGTPAEEVEGDPTPPVAPPRTVVVSEDENIGLNEEAYSAIVRVENEAWMPNYKTPWNAGGGGGGVGTGFLVGPNRFLTNAHVVSNSRLLYIRKVDDPQPHEAEILHIAHDCDLALLALKDPSGFEGIEPLEFGGIPPLDSAVTAVGYPIGGQRISVTRGIVSRVDFRPYAHSAVDSHLAVQVDAAINPGNSGGPIIQDGKVVGVAFQGYSGSVAQNTGYMIPMPVIQRFLNDVEDGQYDYYPDLALAHFEIVNPAQRKALGLPNNGLGVFVSSSDSAGSVGDLLKTGDIIVGIDGYPVSSDGFVNILGARVNMNEIVERKYVGDNVEIAILRDGKPMKFDITLKRFLPYLIQANQYDKTPQFVMFAGLVFQPVDRTMLASHGIANLQVRYLYNYFSQEEIYKDKPQIIVLTDVLADEITTHLSSYQHRVVDEVNGKTIRTLKDLYEALQSEEGDPEFHVIKLMGEGRPIVLERSRIETAQKRIMEKYNIPLDHRLGESIMGD